MTSGLYDDLAARGLLVSHVEESLPATPSPSFLPFPPLAAPVAAQRVPAERRPLLAQRCCCFGIAVPAACINRQSSFSDPQYSCAKIRQPLESVRNRLSVILTSRKDPQGSYCLRD